MATVKQGRLTMGFYMSELNSKSKTNKVSTMSLIVTAASITAYNGAADDAARAATAIGELVAATENLTLGVLKDVQAGFTYEQNITPPAPTAFALDKDKFLFSSRDTTTSDPVKLSIPARDDADITIESDGVTLVLADGAAVADFVTAYEAIALSGDLNAINVLRAVISK